MFWFRYDLKWKIPKLASNWKIYSLRWNQGTCYFFIGSLLPKILKKMETLSGWWIQLQGSCEEKLPQADDPEEVPKFALFDELLTSKLLAADLVT